MNPLGRKANFPSSTKATVYEYHELPDARENSDAKSR